jgi:hypothetical protein
MSNEVQKAEALASMSCTEPPQQYTGTEITTAVRDLAVHGSTGQFVHPGEWDRLVEHRRRVAEERRRAAERRRREEELRREREERRARELAERQKVWDAIGIRKDVSPSRMRLEREAKASPPSPPPPPPADAVPPPPLSIYDGREAPCEICAMTPERDWIIFVKKTGTCR